MARFAPDALGGPPSDVPEFRGGEPERIEVITNLSWIADGRDVGSRDSPIRHM
jgi:hypothetical protein